MLDLNVLSVHTLLPSGRHKRIDVETAFMQWLADQDEATKLKAKRILRNADVDGRYSILSLKEIFTPCSLTESAARYRHASIELGSQVLEEALERAHVKPQDVDVLITTSCTGYMIPSVDAHMADRLGMRSDLIRMPVTEMGCAAGASALIYASRLLTPGSNGIAAIVNIEFPTNTMQHQDFSIDNIVGTALFSDGLACTVLREGGAATQVSVRDCAMYQVPGTTGILGYQLTDNGLRMNLDESLPDVIAEHFESATEELLGRNDLTLHDIEHFVIHPGGIKILDRIQTLLNGFGGEVSRSRDIMHRFGNMSSATVLFILESILGNNPTPGPALLMSFGPGFGAHQLLLSINKRDSS
jgi:alkylresorcinol/alkylpyrone synthase